MKRPSYIAGVGAVLLLLTAFVLPTVLEKAMAPKQWEYTWKPPPKIEARVYAIPWSVRFNSAPGPGEVLREGVVLTFHGNAAQRVADMIARAKAEARRSARGERFPEMRWGIVIARDGETGESIFFGALHRFMRADCQDYEAPAFLMEFMEHLAPLLDPSLPIDVFRHAPEGAAATSPVHVP